MPACGNAILDMVRADYPFVGDLDELRVKIRKIEQFIGSDHDDEFVLFPIDVLVSLRCDLLSGYTSEFSQIGRDGIVGSATLMGDNPVATTAVALTSGHAYRVEASIVRKAFDGSAIFGRAILSYMKAHMQESAQRIVCKRYHSITEQVCRTLLMASDRLGTTAIRLTHEQLAFAIGCRREAVSIATGKLQNAGVIHYAYGRITILERAALENRSCECYSVIRRGFSDFLKEPLGGAIGPANSGFGNG